MQGHLSQQRRDAAPSFPGQPSPNRRRQIAHRGIQANAPTRTALGTRFSVIRHIPSIYERHHGWDIELGFERLKSLIGLAAPPGADERSAKPWILAHLLVILLLEPFIDELEDISPLGARRLTREGSWRTVRQLVATLLQAIRPTPTIAKLRRAK